MSDRNAIPVLTDTVAPLQIPGGRDDHETCSEAGEADLNELQARIAAGSVVLVERLLHSVSREMEAMLFDEVVSRLRNELPDMIDQVLHEHFDADARKS